jgi:hypothetical protein
MVPASHDYALRSLALAQGTEPTDSASTATLGFYASGGQLGLPDNKIILVYEDATFYCMQHAARRGGTHPYGRSHGFSYYILGGASEPTSNLASTSEGLYIHSCTCNV